jgi:hypothetical protein
MSAFGAAPPFVCLCKPTNTVMPESPDECLPQAIADFILDLYDAISTSQVVDEQTNVYGFVWPDLVAK